MDVFSTQPGAIVGAIGQGLPMTLLLQNWHYVNPLDVGGALSYAYPFGKSIMTGWRFGSKGDVQFQHALEDFVSVNVFGEHMGQFQLRGLSFLASCNDQRELLLTEDPTGAVIPTFIPQPHGLEYILGYYRFNRTTTSGAPVLISIGYNTLIEGFLTEIEQDASDPATGIVAFTLTFQSTPLLDS